MLRFAFRLAAFAVAIVVTCMSRPARASPPRAEIRLVTASGREPLGDRYVVGSGITLEAVLPDDAYSPAVIFGASSNIAQVFATSTSSWKDPATLALHRTVLTSFTLREVGIVDVYVVTPDGTSTFARATIEVVPCESVEFAIDPDGPWQPFGEMRRWGGTRIVELAVQCTYDGLPTPDFGSIRLRRAGETEDVELRRNHLGRNVFYVPGVFDFTDGDRYVAIVGEAEKDSLTVLPTRWDDLARLELVPAGWEPGTNWAVLRPHAFDAEGRPIVGVRPEITIDGERAWDGGDYGRIELDEDGLPVSVCIQENRLRDCVELNAAVPVVHYGRGYGCAVAPPSELLDFWPLGLGILFARRVRRFVTARRAA